MRQGRDQREYRGGSAVIDFSDPTAPKEIAFADLDGTNTWSAYTYPRDPGRHSSIPVYANDGLSRNYGTTENPRFPEAAYGFERFQGRSDDARGLAPPEPAAAGARHPDQDHPAPKGVRGRSARPFSAAVRQVARWRLILGEEDLTIQPGETVKFITWTPH